MASRTIPTSLHAATLAQLAALDPATGKPYTTRAVATWLHDEHGVTCSRMAVTRLAAQAHERGEALIIAALREELRDAVGPARARLVKASRKLSKLLADEKNTMKAAAGVRALTASLDSFAKLGGVAAAVKVDVTTGGQPLPDAHAALAAALARLAEEPDGGAAGAAGGEPPA